MFFIFNMSSRVSEDSNELSKDITKAIVKVVEKALPDYEVDIGKFNHIVRKNAHFFGYLLLGMLVCQVLRVSGMRGIKLYAFSLIFCILYAVSDEVHQHFVPGRGPQALDVFIDSSGSTVGIIGNFIIMRIFKKSNFQ